MTTRFPCALLVTTSLALTAAACGGSAEEAASTATADTSGAAAAAADQTSERAAATLTVAGERAGRHALAPTDAYWVVAKDSYWDIYLTGHAMTSSSFAYGDIPPGEILVVAPVENQDGTPIAAGQTFTFNGSANSRLTAMINAASGRETFTIEDDQSLGTLTINEVSGDTIRGEIDVEKGGKVVRGPFVATRLAR